MNAGREGAEGTLAEYMERLASGAPVPGGGSAAALAGAMGAALLAMVIALSRKKAATPGDQLLLEGFAPRAENLWRRFLQLAAEDARAYRAVLAVRKEPQNVAGRAQRRAAALVLAAHVPLETATLAKDALVLGKELAPHCWPAVASDLTTAQALLRAALEGALANVAANLADLEGTERAAIEAGYHKLRTGLGP